jgi:hypothetical protein
VAVILHPSPCGLKYLRGEIIFLIVETTCISQMLLNTSQTFGGRWKYERFRTIGHVTIMFLTPNGKVGIESVVVISGAFMPVVIMVRDQAGMMTVLRDQLGEVDVILFQRAPTPKGKFVLSRPHVASGRHTGVGTDAGLIEGNRIFSEGIQAGRSDPGIAIRTQVVPSQGIHENNNHIHGILPETKPLS